ncbi:MAG: type 4a pilus biogenesis protein PilO [Actinomycetota bacterium]|nr:type 4a pilus biogenesis protein PilO [Actinomycetota bacterium]
MSPRTRLIVAILAIVVVCAAFYFLFVRARQNELKIVNDEIATEQNRTLELRNELARLEELQENAPQLQAELAEIRRLVPQKDEVANFIFLVQEAADASGVDFVEITPELPKAPPEGAPLAEVRLVISGTGGYFALQDFVRRVYALDRAVRIDLLDLTAEDTTGVTDEGGEGFSIRLNATARIFYELPAAPGAAVPGAETVPAPGTTPAPAPAATP